MRIVIPGGSGQVGEILARHFHASGHHVTVLSRSHYPAPWSVLTWDAATIPSRNAADWSEGNDWVAELDHADVCINLTGRSVNCRYNRRNRAAILNSRVQSTLLLNQVIASLPHPPDVWLNASTATIYRHTFGPAHDEAAGILGGDEPGAPSAWNFSIKVAKAWEDALFATPTPRTRKVALRSAMIMSPDPDGVFDAFLRLVRYGLGGTIGPGSQYVSWIHDTDFIRAIECLIQRDNLVGPINVAAPNPLPNRDFQRILREAWGARAGLPTPTWMLEAGALLMRTESELVLKSRRVVPTRLLEDGLQFDFPDWSAAAHDLVARWRQQPR